MLTFTSRKGKELSDNEEIAHVSCWMMRPSPIMIDVEPFSMSEIEKSLLCNEEIIAVNQDRLGMPSSPVYSDEKWSVQIKPLADNTYALAYFNPGEEPAVAPEIEFGRLCLLNRCIRDGRSFSPVPGEYGITGNPVPEKVQLRDLWAEEDLGALDKNLRIGVEGHCARVFKLYW